MTTRQKIGLGLIVAGVLVFFVPFVMFFALRATQWSVSVQGGQSEVELEAGTAYVYALDGAAIRGDDLIDNVTIVDSQGQELPLLSVHAEIARGPEVEIPQDGVYTVTTTEAIDIAENEATPIYSSLFAAFVAIPLSLLFVVGGIVTSIFGVRQAANSSSVEGAVNGPGRPNQ